MRPALAFLVLLAAVGATTAQDKTWVGKTILVKKAGIKIGRTGDDGQQINTGTLNGISYRVLGEQAGWIKVNDGRGNEGWFDKADAVLLEDAVGYFTDRIRQDPKDGVAYNDRATAWMLKGELDIAIKDYGEALRLNPTVAKYNNRGNVWRNKKDYDKAIADYNEAIRLDPNYVFAYNNRGIAWAAKKDYDKAIADYNEAIRLDPKYTLPYYNKVCAYALQGKKDMALDYLRQTLEVGYSNFDHMAKDTDLDSIRNEPRYKELLKKYKK